MFDLRDYKEAIRAAVLEEDVNDALWSWRVISVSKKKVRIGWGYLDYCGEGDKPFWIEMDCEDDVHDDGECWITGHMQDHEVHESLFFTVGNNHWDSTASVEEAVVRCIHAIAHRAHLCY